MPEPETPTKLRPDLSKHVPLIDAVADLYLCGKYSDLTVKCGERQWKLHKAIVCSMSKFFEKACCIGMKESQEGVISLEEDEPCVVEAMIQYIYRADYTNAIGDPDASLPIVFDAQVHAIADKYDIPGLTKLAATKFSRGAKYEWKTPQFAHAIEEVYTSGHANEDLRSSIIEICCQHLHALHKETYGSAFRDTITKVPAFGAELLAKLVSAGQPPVEGNIRKLLCPLASCRNTFYLPNLDVNRNYRCPHCGYGLASGSIWSGWEIKG